jgi:hypothetical protein
MLLERHPGKYDAGLALCAPVGGAPDLIRHAYDFRVVFDYFFPTMFTFPPNQPGEQPFGAADVPENAFLFWETVYVPRIVAALAAVPCIDCPTLQCYQGNYRCNGPEFCHHNCSEPVVL